MSEAVVHECVAILNRLAMLYPEQPAWHDMALRLQDELAQGQLVRSAPTPVDEKGSATAQSCGCCRCRPAADGVGLCAACAALYKAVTARAITGRCDCGHAPTGPVVFVYQGPDDRPVLCGLDCVARHWRGVFSFFIRRSSCEA